MNTRKASIIPVREQIYSRIKKAILCNEYKPGDIIQIDKIAKDFGVSATPIREAFIRLESTGLLTLMPNKGAKVSDISIQDIKDAWEMRKVLETYAGQLSATLDLEPDISRIESDINLIIVGKYNLETYMEVDDNVHNLLFSHISNTMLRDTIKRIHNLSMRMRYQAENLSHSNKDIVNEVCKEHLEIINSLRSKDSERIEKAIKTHLKNGEDRTLNSIHL